MIAEIRLQSNNGASTARFWSAIFDVPAEDLGDGRWRITPAAGPAVVVSTARVVEAISRYVDLTVAVDAGAPDRLRASGFEVAHDGSQAVDVNGCDSTVFLVVRDHMQTIPTVDPPPVARFIATWFEAKQQRPEFGVRWVSVRRTTFEVRPAIAPARQWVPLGASDYAAAVARVVAAGFDVVPSVTHPETAAHCTIGNVTFILTELAHR